MTIEIFDKGYVTDEVSTIPTHLANANEENRVKFVTDCAAISRGKAESNNPRKRFEHLLKEAAPNTCYNGCYGVAGRPLEFLPIIVRKEHFKSIKEYLTQDKMYDYIIPFSYMIDNTQFFTNARALLQAGVPYYKLPFGTEDYKAFFAVRVKAPYFVFAQIRTHCRISQIAASARVIEENELWFPNDFRNRLIDNWGVINDIALKYQVTFPSDVDMKVDAFISFLEKEWYKLSVEDLQNVFKKLKYKKEIWQRYPSHALYKTWVMSGWSLDPRIWNHFFIERGVFDDKYKNWVQPETKKVAKTIYEIYKNKEY